jgi:hypothetical protein
MDAFFGIGGPVGRPRSMEKPVRTSTPPPATMNASSDAPKEMKHFHPTSAATVRMAKTPSATFVALPICAQGDFPASICAKIAAHKGRRRQRENRDDRSQMVSHE